MYEKFCQDHANLQIVQMEEDIRPDEGHCVNGAQESLNVSPSIITPGDVQNVTRGEDASVIMNNEERKRTQYEQEDIEILNVNSLKNTVVTLQEIFLNSCHSNFCVTHIDWNPQDQSKTQQILNS